MEKNVRQRSAPTDCNSIGSVFDFAWIEGFDDDGGSDGASDFELVTRFPQRVLLPDDARTLHELEFGKQEMFLVEK